MIFALLVAAAGAACPARSTTADLGAAVQAAQAAYAAMELDAFQVARQEADALVPCLAELVSPVDAAAYHRLLGLDAYVAKDSLRSLSAFRAAVMLQPGFVLPSTIAPEGNPLHAVYEMARSQPPGPSAALKVPAGTLAYLDGSRAVTRPETRQALVQLSADSGEILWSALLPAGAPDPDWSAFEPAPHPAVASAPAKAARRRPTLGLAIGTGGAAVASGVLFGLAASSRAEFDDLDTPFASVEPLRAQTNAEFAASMGVGAVAVILGTLTVVSLKW